MFLPYLYPHPEEVPAVNSFNHSSRKPVCLQKILCWCSLECVRVRVCEWGVHIHLIYSRLGYFKIHLRKFLVIKYVST